MLKGVITKVSKKGKYSYNFKSIVIYRKFNKGKLIFLIILKVINIRLKVLFYNSIKLFSLTISLGII